MAKEKKYFSPSVTVDVVIFTVEDGELKVLLIERANKPFLGDHALPGGFLLQGETTHAAALRILKEKAGVKDVYIEQLYTFDAKGRDPRGFVISVTYFALVPPSDIVLKKGKDLQAPALYPLRRLPALAFDHADIIVYATRRLRAKLGYTNVAFSLLPKHFSLFQLQKTYETIMGIKIDKRNFQKKFLSLKLIALTNKVAGGMRQRPARLYRFISQKPSELKKFF